MAAKFSGHYQQKDWALATLTTPITTYPFTISFHVKIGDVLNERCLVALKDIGAGYNYWRISYHTSMNKYHPDFPNGVPTVPENNMVPVYHQRRNSTTGGDSYRPREWHAIPDDRLAHYCVVVSSSSQMDTYIDGRPVEYNAWSGSMTTVEILEGNGMTGVYLGSAGGSHANDSALSELAIYSAALTHDQIQQLRTVKPDEISIIPRNYWPLYNSWDDLGADADDFVYNVLAENAIIWETDAANHPVLDTGGTLSTVAADFVHKGVAYTVAGAPYDVPDTVLGYADYLGLGSGFYGSSSDRTVTMQQTRFEHGASRLVDTAYSLPIEVAGYLLETGNAVF